jgi:hypothetical protein
MNSILRETSMTGGTNIIHPHGVKAVKTPGTNAIPETRGTPEDLAMIMIIDIVGTSLLGKAVMK